MSLFSWLSKTKSAKPAPDGAASGRAESAKAAAPAAEPGHRKTERMARRELLYSVVRESMARAGVLSSSYKFKVLSLDAGGRQFLVMVDLAGSEKAEPDLLSDIEQVIAQRAKSRHELTVSAVYWRRNDQVGVGAPRIAAARSHVRAAQPAAGPSQPADLASEPAALAPAPASSRAQAPGGNVDPIQDDELEALRAALADGLGSMPEVDRTPGAAARQRDSAAPRASGFPDTQVRDDDRSRTLSSTQAGDLT
jgi:murein DD-endopeptidase MepM/ murein hydrolase activator NlpD